MISHPAQAPYSVPAIPAHPGTLHVVTCVNNYNRYRSRARLYQGFAKHVADSGAILWTIEAALGSRPFEVTDPANPHHWQVRVTDELWHKENLMNMMLHRLPHDAEFIACIDADIHFARTDWVHETIQQLQHYDAVQMFSSIVNLGPNEEVEGTGHPGFMEAYSRGAPLVISPNVKISNGTAYHPNAHLANVGYSSTFGSPGGAWAYLRSALDDLGGLLDTGILGSSDFFMALGLVGLAQHRLPAGYSQGLKDSIMSWQANAVRTLRKNIGTVPGSAIHHFHGNFKNRQYDSREHILIKHRFDPMKDLKRSANGIYSLVDDGTDRFVQMRNDIRSYFGSRNEDDISP